MALICQKRKSSQPVAPSIEDAAGCKLAPIKNDERPMKRQPKKPLPKVTPIKPPLNGKATLAAATANAAAAAAQVAKLAAMKPPMLELQIPKALPAPVKPPTVEHAKDIEWVTIRQDVLQACLLVSPKKDSRAALGGVYLHANGDGSLRAVATNGHTLLLHSQHTKDLHLPTWLDCGLILPRDGLAMALGCLAKLEGGKDATTCQIGRASCRERVLRLV